MDNSPVHQSRKVISHLKNTGWSWIFLPQYTPELAPIELFFGQLKRLASKIYDKNTTNLDTDAGRQLISNKLLELNQVEIIKIWSHFFNEIENCINLIPTIFELKS